MNSFVKYRAALNPPFDVFVWYFVHLISHKLENHKPQICYDFLSTAFHVNGRKMPKFDSESAKSGAQFLFFYFVSLKNVLLFTLS